MSEALPLKKVDYEEFISFLSKYPRIPVRIVFSAIEPTVEGYFDLSIFHENLASCMVAAHASEDIFCGEPTEYYILDHDRLDEATSNLIFGQSENRLNPPFTMEDLLKSGVDRLKEAGLIEEEPLVDKED